MKEIVIIGGGPAGLTAAIYAARAGRSVKVYEKENLGGQILFSPMVDNYPGMPHMSGAVFVEKLTEQVKELGVEIVMEEVTAIRRTKEGPEVYVIVSESGEEHCRAVILATGVSKRKLGLPGEEELIGCGVSYCAVCDGAFYRDAEVAVVGGGDTALQDALFLAATSAKVTLIHRRDAFRGEKRLADKVMQHPKIEVLFCHTAEQFVEEDGVLTGLILRNTVTGEKHKLLVEGVFLAVGQKPQSQAFAGLVDMDEQGYYYVGEDALTNEPGIFAAGDARIKSVRQLTTAVGDGAVAAVAACEYLELD